MGSYINVDTGEYPVSFSRVRKDNPNVSFSNKVKEVGLYKLVQETTRPDFNPDLQHIAEGSPVRCSGGYMQTWLVTDYTEEQIQSHQAGVTGTKSNRILRHRNQKLKETDWTALSDVHMTDEMRVYRQALRDVTLQKDFPQHVVWPELEGVN
tara:strand:+ start:3031 stop:3486 length:456 start_codon:yes stop_codon:yes gene_type:complete